MVNNSDVLVTRETIEQTISNAVSMIRQLEQMIGRPSELSVLRQRTERQQARQRYTGLSETRCGVGSID